MIKNQHSARVEVGGRFYFGVRRHSGPGKGKCDDAHRACPQHVHCKLGVVDVPPVELLAEAPSTYRGYLAST